VRIFFDQYHGKCLLSYFVTLIPNVKVLYPNFGPKNTYSKYFSILNICLLLLKDCQFVIVYTDILLCFLSQFSFKNLFNCVFVYVFLHFKSSKTFFLHFKSFDFVSDQLHISLHFISMLFAKPHEKGHFSHFLHPSSFLDLENCLWVFSIGLNKFLFNSMLKPISKTAFETFWVRLAPRDILVISYVKVPFKFLKIVSESFQLICKSLFPFHVRIHFRNCIWDILSQFSP